MVGPRGAMPCWHARARRLEMGESSVAGVSDVTLGTAAAVTSEWCECVQRMNGDLFLYDPVDCSVISVLQQVFAFGVSTSSDRPPIELDLEVHCAPGGTSHRHRPRGHRQRHRAGSYETTYGLRAVIRGLLYSCTARCQLISCTGLTGFFNVLTLPWSRWVYVGSRWTRSSLVLVRHARQNHR